MEKSLLRIANFAKNNSNYYTKKYSKHEINEIKDFYKLPLSDSKMFWNSQSDIINVGSGRYGQPILLVDNEN
ncbi:MAG: hypothetical protein ACRCZW_10580 [Lactobacillaceae bacterium]